MLEDMKNPYIRNTLLGLFIALSGFVLLNLTFLFYAAIINGVEMLLPSGFVQNNGWYMPVMMALISLGIIIGYIFVYKSKIEDIYKATLMTIPTAIILIMDGIALYRWSYAAFPVGAILTAGALYYFYKAKKPWLYWFAVIIVALALTVMVITGTEI